MQLAHAAYTVYAIYMKVVKHRLSGTYIQFRDRKRKRKSECLTVDDLTPKQAMLAFARFLRNQHRKAS